MWVGSRQIKCFLSSVVLIVSCLGSKGNAFSDGIANQYWHDIIESYWYLSPWDYGVVDSDLVLLEDQALSIPGVEPRPFVLERMHKASRVRDFLDVTCADFALVPTNGLDPDDPVLRAARGNRIRMSPVSSIAGAAFGGLTRNLGFQGWLAREWYWVAAMLPDNAEPLFNENGIGINPDVFSKPSLAESRLWQLSSYRKWAAKVELREIMRCGGFDIYFVEYRP